MRILQVIPSIRTGGAERMVANLARHLCAAGHAVGTLALYDPEGMTVEADLRAHGVEVCSLGKKRGFDPRMIPRAAKAIARFEPAVIHTHMYVLKYVLPTLALRRTPAVHTLHNLADREGSRGDVIVQQVAFRTMTAPVAIGDAIAESVRRLYRLEVRRIIPNGIPVSDFAPPPGAREALRATLGIPLDTPVLVSVGRFMQQKDHATLVHALASERLRRMAPHLLLAGSGELQGNIERLVREFRLSKSVHFLGQRQDVPAVLAAADIFVLPSLWEGHPLSVMEAMAAGKPVVATRVGSVPELVLPGTGQLVNPGDISALESALAMFVSDPALVRTRGAEALRVARERFDATVMARAYEELYREVVA